MPFLDTALLLLHFSWILAVQSVSILLRHQAWFSSFQPMPFTTVQYEKQLPLGEIIHHSEHDAFIWFLPKVSLFRCHFIVPQLSVFCISAALRYALLTVNHLTPTGRNGSPHEKVVSQNTLLSQRSSSFQARCVIIRFNFLNDKQLVSFEKIDFYCCMNCLSYWTNKLDSKSRKYNWIKSLIEHISVISSLYLTPISSSVQGLAKWEALTWLLGWNWPCADLLSHNTTAATCLHNSCCPAARSAPLSTSTIKLSCRGSDFESVCKCVRVCVCVYVRAR